MNPEPSERLDEEEPPQSAALPDAAVSASSLPDRPAAFLNALLTEHFVLESARGITVTESSSRASLYLTMLSRTARRLRIPSRPRSTRSGSWR